MTDIGWFGLCNILYAVVAVLSRKSLARSNEKLWGIPCELYERRALFTAGIAAAVGVVLLSWQLL